MTTNQDLALLAVILVATPGPAMRAATAERGKARTNADRRPGECLYPELADPAFRITPEESPCGA